MPLETIAAYAVSIAAIVSFIVQKLKEGLIDPHTQDSPARNALLQSLTYALNLGMLLGFLALNHALDWSQLLLYASLALGQTVGSHVFYSTLKTGSSPAPADAPADDVSEAPLA